MSLKDGVNHLGGDESTPDVDPNMEFLPCGQGAGEITELMSAADVVATLMADARQTLSRIAEFA